MSRPPWPGREQWPHVIAIVGSAMPLSMSVGQPCRFHDHSHAAMLIQAGTHAKRIQRRLGHASIGVTLNTYGHLVDGLDEEAADALDASWLSLADGSKTDQAGGSRP